MQKRVGQSVILLRMITLLLVGTARVCADPTRKPSPEPTRSPTLNPTVYPTIFTGIAVSPHTISFSGYEQNFTVPENVTSITVTLYGGSGMHADNAHGRGAMISSIVPVIPGEVLMVMVGSTGYAVQGGFNGGGNRGSGSSSDAGGGGGGGASDIRRSPYTFEDRILVAGGGGGAGYLFYGDGLGGDAGVEAKR